MIGLGVLLLILGIVVALLVAFIPPLGTYRNYGWGLGVLLIVVGVVLIVIGYLMPTVAV